MEPAETIPDHEALAAASCYPPKYQPDTGSSKGMQLHRSLLSLVLYLGIGYTLFKRLDFVLAITAIIVLHELGHYLAMQFFNYSDLGIFFIPLFGAFVSGTKREVSQRQNAVILLAGPLPGIILGIVLYFIDKNSGGMFWGGMSVGYIALLLIWLNLLNLLPLFPLDGGQLLNRVFLDEEGWVSNVFIAVSALLVCWLAISTHFYILFVIPVLLFFRFLGTRRHINLEKKILERGIDLDTSYEDLSDEDYWKIRAIVVRNTPALVAVKEGPPYEFDPAEDKVMQQVEQVLQRNLLMDISLFEKILVIIIWLLALASPFMLNIEMPFIRYLT